MFKRMLLSAFIGGVIGVITHSYIATENQASTESICIEDEVNGTIKAETVQATLLTRLSDGAQVQVLESLNTIKANPDLIKVACPK